MDEDEEAARRPENKLTDQQKGELRACFDSFDEDGSGFLCAPPPSPSLRCASRARRDSLPRSPRPIACPALPPPSLFLVLRPGRDLDEVGNALRMIGLCTTEDEIRQAVTQIDVGGDGNIQWDEFLHFMAKQMAEPKLMNNEFDMAFDGETRAARGSYRKRGPPLPRRPLTATLARSL